MTTSKQKPISVQRLTELILGRDLDQSTASRMVCGSELEELISDVEQEHGIAVPLKQAQVEDLLLKYDTDKADDLRAICEDDLVTLLREVERMHGIRGLPDGFAIYVASRASIPARSAMWRQLRETGAPIISTWIDEAGAGETKDLSELWARIEAEIRRADRLVLYVEPEDFPLKGAFIEVGMALALGKPVYVVLPGVTLQPGNWSPLGSWARHPLVQFADDAQSAVTMVEAGFAFPACERG